MLNLKPYTQAIIWDFDGVILNSNEVRDQGFIEVLREYKDDEIEVLLDFHRKNGGLSRYVKFEYFFKEVLKKPFETTDIQLMASQFSLIMKQLLTDKNLLIRETIEFVKEHYEKIPMHIVSGSDGKELRYLCIQLDIAHYFKTIDGSPTPKVLNLKKLIKKFSYNPSQLVLIGDSINDYEAAKDNEVAFVAYNNISLNNLSNY